MSRHPHLLRYGRCSVISTGNALCGSHGFQHNVQLFVAQRCELSGKSLVLLKSPDRHSLLVAVLPVSQ
jgi:hypothetical protein